MDWSSRTVIVLLSTACCRGYVPAMREMSSQRTARRLQEQYAWRQSFLSKGSSVIGSGLLDGEECALPPNDEEMLEVWEGMMAETKGYDTVLFASPLLAPLVALFSYETAAKITRNILDALTQRNWESVDGNTYQISILTPVVNGIVVPAVSIALGTMVATTVSTLRQRQVDIRNLLNSELCALDVMRAAINTMRDEDFFDPTDSDTYDDVPFFSETPTARLTLLLRDYVSRLIREARPDFNAVQAKIADNELAAIVSLLFIVNTNRKRAIAATQAARDSASILMDLRSERLAKLSAVYPAIHYIILGLCALSIVAAFLIESDQEVLRFLDALQLRLLFTMLVGAFAGLTALVVDLADIHKGSLRITPTAVQFFSMHDYLSFDLCSRLGIPETPPTEVDITESYFRSKSSTSRRLQQNEKNSSRDNDDRKKKTMLNSEKVISEVISSPSSPSPPAFTTTATMTTDRNIRGGTKQKEITTRISLSGTTNGKQQRLTEPTGSTVEEEAPPGPPSNLSQEK